MPARPCCGSDNAACPRFVQPAVDVRILSGSASGVVRHRGGVDCSFGRPYSPLESRPDVSCWRAGTRRLSSDDMTSKLVSYLPGLAAAAAGFASGLAIAGLFGAIGGSMGAYAAYFLVADPRSLVVDSRSRQARRRAVTALIVGGFFVAVLLNEFDVAFSTGFITGVVAVVCGAAIAVLERSRRNAGRPTGPSQPGGG
jgi:hypothetical protein